MKYLLIAAAIFIGVNILIARALALQVESGVFYKFCELSVLVLAIAGGLLFALGEYQKSQHDSLMAIRQHDLLLEDRRKQEQKKAELEEHEREVIRAAQRKRQKEQDDFIKSKIGVVTRELLRLSNSLPSMTPIIAAQSIDDSVSRLSSIEGLEARHFDDKAIQLDARAVLSRVMTSDRLHPSVGHRLQTAFHLKMSDDGTST